MPNIVSKLTFPPKTDKVLGLGKNTWCKFHKAFGHDEENCIVLGYQLSGVMKVGLLQDYLVGGQEESKLESPSEEQRHEVPILGEINTISGGFYGGGCTASQRKKYAREVMIVRVWASDQPSELDLCFTHTDLRDVVPHDNDPMVISMVIVGRRVHRVLVDQGSSADVIFWSTFIKLQLSPDRLRPYNDCLYGFAGNQVEMRGHVELRTTFTDDTSSCTINIKYLVVNVVSAYNILLSRPAINRLGAVASSRHMKMKLPSPEGGVIVIKSDQKAARKCYENSLKNRRGVFVVTTRPLEVEEDSCVEIATDSRSRVLH